MMTGIRLAPAHWAAAFLAFVAACTSHAQDQSPARHKPVPRMQVTPQPNGQASIERDGDEISRYWFDTDLKRPFLFPMIGPAGRSLTRMGHPRDPNSHSHHNSVWVSHHDVSGVDFWGDGGKGRIVPKRVVRYEDTEAEALIQVQNAWVDDAGKPLLNEYRTMRFQPLDENEWRLVLDIELTPVATAVTLGKTPFGLVGVRMAKTIGVHDGGGTIRNSEGGVDEEQVLWKRARWVDYSGPISREAIEGITLMDHPGNPNHPTYFHVRNDGWMGTSLTYDAPRTLEAGDKLNLRYGLWVHAGEPGRERIDEQFAEFAKTTDPPAIDKK
jgi:hypothetical protein